MTIEEKQQIKDKIIEYSKLKFAIMANGINDSYLTEEQTNFIKVINLRIDYFINKLKI